MGVAGGGLILFKKIKNMPLKSFYQHPFLPHTATTAKHKGQWLVVVGCFSWWLQWVVAVKKLHFFSPNELKSPKPKYFDHFRCNSISGMGYESMYVCLSEPLSQTINGYIAKHNEFWYIKCLKSASQSASQSARNI